MVGGVKVCLVFYRCAPCSVVRESTQFGTFDVVGRTAVGHRVLQMLLTAVVVARRRFRLGRQWGSDANVERCRRSARGRRHRRRSSLILVCGTQRHIDKFAHDHGHSVLHQVENVLAVIEETDQMEGAERSDTPQSQIANHHRTLKMDEIIQN